MDKGRETKKKRVKLQDYWFTRRSKHDRNQKEVMEGGNEGETREGNGVDGRQACTKGGGHEKHTMEEKRGRKRGK